jgi:uncharacterized phiE125 gp8 family phage protein
MLLTEVAPATLNPVPLRELSLHLRLSHGFADDGAEDALLELYLRNATAAIETRLSRALIRRTYVLQVASWDRNGHLTLPIGPVGHVDTIRFIRPGSTIDLTPEEWMLHPGESRQRLTGSGSCALRALPHGALAELGFSAGYGSSWNAVPDDLRQAVLLLAAHYYEHRSAEEPGSGFPHAVRVILEPHRPVRL